MKVKRINQRIGKKKGGVKGCKAKNYRANLCIGSSPMIQ
jgi:hypothetical protein